MFGWIDGLYQFDPVTFWGLVVAVILWAFILGFKLGEKIWR